MQWMGHQGDSRVVAKRHPGAHPSSGVSPMLVSTLWPCCTAVMLAPAPRWPTIRFTESALFPSILAACPEAATQSMPCFSSSRKQQEKCKAGLVAKHA